ncbi:MAG: 2-amino-4-hydroxy-6-hydroxymethyldihydropteridine diphosphokinase [Paracoccaceae bacterium]
MVALGSNATSRHGDPAATVEKALVELDRAGLRVVARSRLYRTPFVPAGGGADVTNAAAVLSTGLVPGAVMAVLHRIEADFDRSRATRWGTRTLDLDLLMVGEQVLPDLETFLAWQGLTVDEQRAQAPDALILPHPRMAERAFVLVPAAEVAADWRHPVLGRTLVELRDALPAAEVAAVRALGN